MQRLCANMSPHRRRQIVHLLGILSAAYAAYVALLASQQSHLIFAGNGIPMTIDLREDFPLAHYTSLDVDGVGQVHACYLESEREFEDGPIALVAHGNAETIGHWKAPAAELLAAGLSVFLVEYPGYGGSEGTPNHTTITATFDAAYAWLESEHGAGQRLLIGVGRSLGSGPICDLATRKRMDGLVLISPFESMGRVAWGLGVPPFLLGTSYDNARALASYGGPVLLLHGADDGLISPRHSQALAKKIPQATLHLLEETDHVSLVDGEHLAEPLKTWLDAQVTREMLADHPS